MVGELNNILSSHPLVQRAVDYAPMSGNNEGMPPPPPLEAFGSAIGSGSNRTLSVASMASNGGAATGGGARDAARSIISRGAQRRHMKDQIAEERTLAPISNDRLVALASSIAQRRRDRENGPFGTEGLLVTSGPGVKALCTTEQFWLDKSLRDALHGPQLDNELDDVFVAADTWGVRYDKNRYACTSSRSPRTSTVY